MKKKTFEKELPESYQEIYVVDATTKKFTIVMNLAALLITLIITISGTIIIRPSLREIFDTPFLTIRMLVFTVILFAYIVLHELVHGLFYKILTKQKLKFGFSVTVAFCGVPDIYVYRSTAMVALLAPFIIFLPVFIIPAIFCPFAIDKFLAVFMLASHVGGCTGDLYDTFLYCFKFKNPMTLMQDTGPKQTFYIPAKTDETL